MRRPLALIPIFGLTILLAAVPVVAVGGSQGPQAGASDDFDRTFLHQMVMHHMMAVMMAEPVATGAVHEEVRSLAGDIILGQSAEIARMQGWLAAWYRL